MVFQHVLQICAAIIASVGGAAVIILAASKFIANTLAERALAKQQHEFEQLNINFQHQLELATRRVQVELDALAARV